jgi:hypothetical protein
MAKALLVNLDVEIGSRIIEALDASGLKVNVALWATLPEYGDTRLVLASRHFDEDNQIKSYGKVLGALREQGVPHRQVPEMLVLRMKDPFIRDLRKLFGKTASVEGMRLGGQSFGDRFIEDGYVYRIS